MRSPLPSGQLAQLAALLLLTPSCLVSCTNSYQLLVDEDQDAHLAQLKSAAVGMPRRCERVPIQVAADRIAWLQICEVGPGDAERTVVLLPGIMSDSRVWRFIEGDLGSDYRLIEIEMLGCGQSDAPDPSLLPPDTYGPTSLARGVLQALRTPLAASKPGPATKITLVGHSLGGMVELRMFTDAQLRADFDEILSRVDSMVLFSPAHVAIAQCPPELRLIEETPDIIFQIAAAVGILRERVAESTLEGASTPELALKQEADRFCDMIADSHHRRAAKAMLQRSIPRHGNHPDWPAIRVLAGQYSRVDPPCLIVWGAEDEMLPASIGFMFMNDLPNARLCLVTGAKHSLPLERPALCSRLLREFVGSRARFREAVRVIDGRRGEYPASSEVSLKAELRLSGDAPVARWQSRGDDQGVGSLAIER